ncbi:hypothetical protein ACH4LS_00075 [Streptomyces luteogriseus]|uniref:hypothetical protein n=1 Tax=Streptomyces luteogriseus TaxID=68233 RepID=UPI0037B359A7
MTYLEGEQVVFRRGLGPVEGRRPGASADRTQINQLPADRGGGAVAPATGSLVAKAQSINGNANLLIEIAGFLHEAGPMPN